MLEGYGRIDASFPERIMAMAELQQKVQADAIASESRTVARGVTIGAWTPLVVAIVGFGVMALGMFLHSDMAAIGGAVPAVITASASLVSALRKQSNGQDDQS
jgi:uncharacterized membrane protein